MHIRKAKRGDAKQLIELFAALDSETEFMLFEPGERSISEPEQIEFIERLKKTNHILLLVAVSNGIINGFLGATGEQNCRNKHIAKFAMGVKQQFWGKGLGKLLLANFEKWAINQHYYRIEMTVQKPNVRAQRLYKSCGFEVEGIRKNSLKIGGRYVNELYMAKLLNP